MSNILAITPVQFSITIGTNEDWTDAWGYYDNYGQPLPGSYIVLTMMMRQAPASVQPLIIAGNQPGLIQGVAQNGALGWFGPQGALIRLAIPRATMQVIPPGSYVAEVQGSADGVTRTIATIAVTVNQGIVR